jgi:hypothetical protein
VYTLPVSATSDGSVSVQIAREGYWFPAASVSVFMSLDTVTPVKVTAVLSGVNTVGSTLSVVTTATVADVDFRFEWFRGSAKIAGVSGPSYVVQAADDGYQISVKATGSRPRVPGFVPVVVYTNGIWIAEPMSVTKAQLPSAALTGSTISVDLEFTPADASVSVEWFRGGSKIVGASGLSYVLVAADHGQLVSAKVTLTKFGYATLVVYTNSTAVFSPAGPVFTAVVLPTGSIGVGAVLDVHLLGVSDAASVKVEWFRGSSKIAGAAGMSYTTVAADVVTAGVSVKVTVTEPGFAPVVMYSNGVRVT